LTSIWPVGQKLVAVALRGVPRFSSTSSATYLGHLALLVMLFGAA
jgi:hypothetical protein